MAALNSPNINTKPTKQNVNIQQILQSCFYFLLGFISLSVIFIYSVLVSPIFLYRLIITKIAPHFRLENGEAVSVMSHFMTAEFIPERNSSSSSESNEVVLPRPRNVIVVCNTFTGTITLKEISEAIRRGWLTPRNGEMGKLRYPEFQQYPEMWMGFMFWTQDKSFSLENHVYAQRIPDNESKEKSEKYLCDLVETLVNKRFTPERSPWEVHLLQNYREPSPHTDGKNHQENFNNEDIKTVIIFRFHHGLADGYSALNAFIEGLLGVNLNNVKLAIPKNVHANQSKRNELGVIVANVKKLAYKTWRTVYDAGYVASLHLPFRKYSSVPWYVPDTKKKWKQLYARSKLIPANKIKFVKNKLGASFTGVLLSCLEAGSAKSLIEKGVVASEKLPILFAVPLPNHPMKLRNHATATLIEFNVTPNMDSVERLESVNRKFVEARHFSQMPFVMIAMGKLMSFPLAPLAKVLSPNRFAPTALSNFPGPGAQMKFLGRDMIAMEFCIGGMVGVAGVIFSMISYHGHVRLTVTAENGVMEREELSKLISYIEMEMDKLHEHAKQIDKKHGKSSDKT